MYECKHVMNGNEVIDSFLLCQYDIYLMQSMYIIPGWNVLYIQVVISWANKKDSVRSTGLCTCQMVLPLRA